MSKTKTPTLDEFRRIESAHADLDMELDRLLHKRGWVHTSSNPMCVWLWEKKLPDGRIIMTDASTAKDFETELCGELEFDEEA